jgi:hypothetical protein
VNLRLVFPSRLRRYLEIAGLDDVLRPEFVDHEPPAAAGMGS